MNNLYAGSDILKLSVTENVTETPTSFDGGDRATAGVAPAAVWQNPPSPLAQEVLKLQQKDVSSQQPPGDAAPEIDPSEILFDEQADFIGEGVFGRVFKGVCRGQAVAVKVPRDQAELSEQQLEDFRQEVAIMRRVFHPNCVLFLGACTRPGNIMLVTEYLTNGSVEQLLASERPLPVELKLSIAMDVSRGLAWLHGITKIIHRDLKPANLLIDQNERVKVCDFGFSQMRQKQDHARETEPRGTVMWMSPEILTAKPFNEKVDVYSFGMILWELVTRRPLFGNRFTELKPFLVAVVRNNERPTLTDADCNTLLQTLIRRCWDRDPRVRPSFTEIIRLIDDIVVDEVLQLANAAWLPDALSVWRRCEAPADQALKLRVALPSFCNVLKLQLSGVLDAQMRVGSAYDVAALERAATGDEGGGGSGDDDDCLPRKRRRVASSSTTSTAPTDGGVGYVEQLGDLLCQSAAGTAALQASLRVSTNATPPAPRSSPSRGPPVQLSGGTVSLARMRALTRCFGPFFLSGALGAQLCQRMVDVLAQPYFHADIEDKEVAVRRLANRSDRTFLVRQSSTVDGCPFAISLVKDGVVLHKRVQCVFKAGYAPTDPLAWLNCKFVVPVAGRHNEQVEFDTLHELVCDPRLQLQFPCPRDELQAPYMM